MGKIVGRLRKVYAAAKSDEVSHLENILGEGSVTPPVVEPEPVEIPVDKPHPIPTVIITSK